MLKNQAIGAVFSTKAGFPSPCPSFQCLCLHCSSDEHRSNCRAAVDFIPFSRSVPLIRYLSSLVALGLLCSVASMGLGGEWTIPMAGNAFRLELGGEGRRGGFQRDGSVRVSKPADTVAAFFRVDRPAKIQLSVRARPVDGKGGLVAKVGSQSFAASAPSAEFEWMQLGEIAVEKAGYVRVELAVDQDVGEGSVDIQELKASSVTDGLIIDFVRNNEGNMFYWGRRGPSVHLTYDTPKDVSLQYAYSEITVPAGMDVEGSYFMANGFAEGYFGFQVNGPQERRVLFSVWSPFQTDNPKEIPEEQRITKLASGPGVRVGEFGNEGSGGQSFLVYPWKAGVAYRFLTEVKPDPNSKEHTLYTAWFGDKSQKEWRLIASFRRPKTSTYLKSFHSFLENFNPQFGHLTRGANYGNVWVVDKDGTWYECIQARLSADATARGRHRLDYNGGADGDHFFMKNCGFFDDVGKVGSSFNRESTSKEKPEIDFSKLPR